MYKIAFDVMGSDKGATVAIQAAVEFLKTKTNLKLIFIGNEQEIKQALVNNGGLDDSQYEILATTEIIDMDGSIMDVRRKKDASLVRALELVKEQKVDAMLTGGNSAAFIAGAHFILGEFEGVTRPGFMPTMPTLTPGVTTLMLDVGANVENTAEDLLGYAKMASIYSREVQGVKSPRIGLMNIGEEASKGRDLQKEAYQLLKADKSLNFVGNIESREMTTGVVEVLVADGYSGNIALKAMEGMGKNILRGIKESLTKNLYRKLHALALKKAFKEFGNRFDYKNYAGAILIGVNGIIFKSHGSSDVQSFKATLRMTLEAVENDVLTKMKKGMAE
ncbi:phosphate acyltransferase PlsX [Mesoplasma syrphidae]|uniref:Phosphate acyltransferase n=1 Tax=Mesoplasma syrphidae TaxID=225999 RepID=A0A2K9BJE0_9MOLU|nr:phosphate acyltransferase PlsX [Mesoplasma syrphidae]AUF83406.1 phosphate acyltransferase PlsX [Mesoplasma syrphidae]